MLKKTVECVADGLWRMGAKQGQKRAEKGKMGACPIVV